ncbi:MAG: hypothetical protein ACR2N3_10490 [Pyrinomonadaceae bacterium]
MLTALIIIGLVGGVLFVVRKMAGKTNNAPLPSITDSMVNPNIDPNEPIASMQFSVIASVIGAGIALIVIGGLMIAIGAEKGSPVAALAAIVTYKGMRSGKISW